MSKKKRYYTQKTIKNLFATSKNKCAFPDCNHNIVNDKGTVIGEICHISALNEGGARYNENLKEDKINCFDNLILLCPTHHKTIDKEPKNYSVEVLNQWKKQQISNNKTNQFEFDLEQIYNQVKEIKIFQDAEEIKNYNKIENATFIQTTQQAQTKLPKKLTNIIPTLPEADIIGRKDILNDLYEMLSSNKPVVVVNGLGGIGKTTVAQVFVSKYYEKYQHIIWITQTQGNDIFTQFATAGVLRKNLKIPENLSEPKDVFNEIIRALNQINDKPNLMIIDNADNSLEKIKNQLPDADKWHILITSRNRLNGYTLKPLDFLSTEHAYKLFTTHYTKSELSKKEIYQIIESVDKHTLSIEILAKTSNIIEYNFEELQNALKQNIEINLEDIRHSDDSKLEKINIYLSEIFKLSNLDDDELWIMKNFTYLPSEFIEYNTIKELIIEDKAYKKLPLTLQKLNKKGWLLHDAQTNAYKMHLIIAETVKQQSAILFKDIDYLIQTVTEKLSIDQTKDNPVDKFPWTPYGTNILQSIKAHPPTLSEHENKISKLQNNLATVLQDLGDYTGAKELLEKALISAEKNFGKEHPTTAVRYSNLALVLKDLGDYTGAKELLEKALISDEKNFGIEHPNTAVTYFNLAAVYFDLKDYKKAINLAEKAYLIYKNHLGDQHPNTKIIKGNLDYIKQQLKK